MHSRAIFSNDLNANLTRAIQIANASKVILVTDKNTSRFCLPLLKEVSYDFHCEFESGESNKNFNSLEQLLRFLIENKIDKKAILIALGGGMVTDLTGYAASCYKRGIRYISIPTTLLSMVDAGIGGKTGIDFMDIKNVVGAFYPPTCILSDASFFKTLPIEELTSGWAEVIKHLLIENQPIPNNIPTIDNSMLNYWSGIKYNIIREDPFEKNIRLALNAGHTVGHALEAFYLKKGDKLLHGHAVAAGLWIEAHLQSVYFESDWTLNQIANGIFNTFGKVTINPSEIEEIITLMLNDKKNKNGNIVCSLLKTNGNLQVTEVSKTQLTSSLLAYIDA